MQRNMDLIKPQPFKPNKNQVAKDWHLWKTGFINYLRVSDGYKILSEEQRAYLLQNLMGQEAVKAMESITFETPSDQNDMDVLLAKFDEFYCPPTNLIQERYKFFSRFKGRNENIDDYISDLKEKSKTCNFGPLTERFIVDMIIRSMDNYLREMTFRQNLEKLVDVVECYKQYTTSNDKIKELSKNMAKGFNSDYDKKEDYANHSSSDTKKTKGCWRCNTVHRLGFCPAYGKICNVCNRKDHLDGLCQKDFKVSKEDDLKKLNLYYCSKCDNNHPYMQCPARNNLCNFCNERGHYFEKCEKRKLSKNNVNNATNQQDQASNSDNKVNVNVPVLVDCTWCDVAHAQGQCIHDNNCPMCNEFPHIICFNCKTNPHGDTCKFKKIVRLPSMNNNNIISRCAAHQYLLPKTICLDCMRKNWRKFPSKKYEEETSFVHVQTTEVPAQMPRSQPRHTYQPPPYKKNNTFNKKTKKDDPCCIS